MRFQNIVAIEHWAVQFWSETILVISNQTHSFRYHNIFEHEDHPLPYGSDSQSFGHINCSQNAWVMPGKMFIFDLFINHFRKKHIVII